MILNARSEPLSLPTFPLHRPAPIDYFATSLPGLLVFDEDLQARREAEHHLLLALAAHGLGEPATAAAHLAHVLGFSNSDRRAADLAHELAAHAPPLVGSAAG